jgi:hypothetical protein
VYGLWSSAAGAGKTVCARGACPTLLGGPSTSPLDVALDRPAPPLGSFARTFVVLNRISGTLAIAGGLLLLAKCGWHLLEGAKQWSQEYFAVSFGIALVIAGTVYLRAPLWRRQRESGRDASSQDY